MSLFYVCHSSSFSFDLIVISIEIIPDMLLLNSKEWR